MSTKSNYRNAKITKGAPKGMRSKFEGRIAKQLKDEGIPYEYEAYNYNYHLKVPKARCWDCHGKKGVYSEHVYTPDFFCPSGLIIEAKGLFSAKDRKKHLAVRELHPELDLRFLFMSNNKLSKWTETRYADWCEANEFKYAIKAIPDEWIEEMKDDA